MKPRKKILLVVPSLRRGGAERVAAALTRAWSREHEVTLAVFNAAERAYVPGGTFVDLRAPAARGLRSAGRFLLRVRRLRALLRALRPDLVIGFMETANIPLLIAALTTGDQRRLTLSLRGNPEKMALIHRFFAFLFYRFAARRALPSQGAASAAAKTLGLRGGDVKVIRSPLDLEEIAARAAEPPPGPPVDRYFFAAGRLVPGKDFARLLRIFAAAETGGARLVLAGGGPEREALEALVAALGLHDRVRLLGETDNPFAWMKGALAFLMTSRHEGFPMVLIEAFACACPVIAFDCDFGPREAVRDGENGFLVPMHEDGTFVERLERVAFDPELRARLGAAAAQAAQEYALHRAAARWLEGKA
jgi:GalNAc-alpha-(1->4)-GalNAc-alpha-(1->3)-diNAcBac-PP-undecaprenol alpha-1,4-N-acetyl-D-galactosaminyltransferase